MRAPITIVVTTYFPAGPVGDSRFASCLTALKTWAKFLRYDGELHYEIINSPDMITADHELALRRALKGKPVSFGFTNRGVGAALNLGFLDSYAAGAPLTLYAADDWALDAPCDLSPWADLLIAQPPAGVVRLGPPHPDLTGTVLMLPQGWVLRLDRHHYAFGHRPALYHQRMFEAYGRFDENSSAWECERLYNEHFCATPGPDVVYALPYPWRHVGETEVGDHEP